ncbi:MAG: formate dehydrogenase accessory sulfurtransferase FdhD [Thermodesulfobacteriota bacterium]
MESGPRSIAVLATEHLAGTAQEKIITLVAEGNLRVWVDGNPCFSATRTPGAEKAHALGLCLGAGLVRSLADIREVRYDPEIDRDRVDVFRQPGLADDFGPPVPVSKDATLAVSRVADLIRALFDSQTLRVVTRSTHAAILCDLSFSPAFSAEDVSRQAAMDKVLGGALLAGELSRVSCALLTCRINQEAVRKFARASVPILISVSRPTAAAVETARDLNMALVLFGDAGSVVVFSGDQRVK